MNTTHHLCGTPARIPFDHSAGALGDLAAPCNRPAGHGGDHGNGRALWEAEAPKPAPSSVRVVGGAIVVSDADPADVEAVRQAREVLEHSTEVLNASHCTLHEARFAAVELARNLRTILDVFVPEADAPAVNPEAVAILRRIDSRAAAIRAGADTATE